MGEYDLTAIVAARRSMEEAERELIRLSLAAVKYGHAIETVAQGAAASYAAAACRTSRSRKRGATICNPTGRSSAVKPQGTLAAGAPEKLNG